MIFKLLQSVCLVGGSGSLLYAVLISNKQSAAPVPENSWDDNWDKRKSLTLAALKDGPQKICKKHYIFIRHGQYNTKGITDDERSLTPLGCEQANLTGKWLAQLNLSNAEIIQSTMTRAKNTCAIISKQFPDAQVLSSDLLREGSPIPPVPSNYKVESELKYFADSPRIESAFRRFVYRPSFKEKEESVQIFVCHANVIRYFVCRAMQFPPGRWLRMSLRHGSITWITVYSNGEVNVRCIGDSGHMPPSKLSG